MLLRFSLLSFSAHHSYHQWRRQVLNPSVLCFLRLLWKRKQSCPSVGRSLLLLSSDVTYLSRHQFPHLWSRNSALLLIVVGMKLFYTHTHILFCVCVHTHIHACLGQKHFWISSDTLPMPHFIKSRRTEGNIIIPFKTHIHSPQPTRLRTNPVQYSRPSWVRSRIHFSATFPMMLHLSWVTEHDLPLLTFMLFSYLSLYLHQSL